MNYGKGFPKVEWSAQNGDSLVSSIFYSNVSTDVIGSGVIEYLKKHNMMPRLLVLNPFSGIIEDFINIRRISRKLGIDVAFSTELAESNLLLCRHSEKGVETGLLDEMIEEAS